MKITLAFFLTTCFYTLTFGQDCPTIDWETLANPGPFEVATLQEGDGLRDGPDYDGATIYYPSNPPSGLRAIAIVPGFLAGPDSIEEWGPFYASHGIIAMIIGTNSLSAFPEDRALALIDALETLRQENTRSLSPLRGKIAINKMAVSGWSMGGGGAQRAAVLDHRIKAVIALCPWLNQPELDHDAPVLIFGGQLDAVAPPSVHATAHYMATPETTDKLRFIVKNAGHQVANSPQGGDRDIGRMALSWLRYYLSIDDCYCPLLLDEPEPAFMYETNVECDNVTTSTTLIPQNQMMVYPNPANTTLTVDIGKNKTAAYELFTVLGQRIRSGMINTQKQEIDISELPANLYLLKIGKEMIKVQVL